MEKNERLISWLADFGLTMTPSMKNGQHYVETSGRLGAMGRMLQDVRKAPLCQPSNRDYLGKILDERGGFAGGSLDDLYRALNGQINMEPFNKAREKFQKSALGRKLQEKIAATSIRRRRQMSEHDGEWDYGRRWELTPFHRAYKRPEPARTIEIVCDFSISCAASADGINQYGAMVWALSDLIEKLGIQTRIVYVNKCTGVLASRSSRSLLEIELKKAGEYLAPSLLAASLTSVFYRRGVFSIDIMIADSCKDDVSYGLGQPERVDKPIKFEKGKLYLGPNVYAGYDKEIEQELYKALEIEAEAA